MARFVLACALLLVALALTDASHRDVEKVVKRLNQNKHAPHKKVKNLQQHRQENLSQEKNLSREKNLSQENVLEPGVKAVSNSKYQLILNGDNKNGLENLNLVCSSGSSDVGKWDRKDIYKSAESINNEVNVKITLVELVPQVESSTAKDNAKRDKQD